MKPDFALSLSFEGIVLYQRAPLGWVILGEVALDDPALDSSLTALRDKAIEASGGSAQVKLVLPNEQIRYLNLEALSESEAAARDQARDALDGATPYAVDDLQIDVSVARDRVYVAAVARETLAEAESFAAAHGFEPVCFVAIPADNSFAGEVWFGPSEAWRSGGNAPATRDDAAIVVLPYDKGWPAEPVASPPPNASPAEDDQSPDQEPRPEAAEQVPAPDPVADDTLPADTATDDDTPDDGTPDVAGDNSSDPEPPVPASAPEQHPDQDSPASDAPKVAFTSIRAVRNDAGPRKSDVLENARKLSASRDTPQNGPRFSLSAVANRISKSDAPNDSAPDTSADTGTPRTPQAKKKGPSLTLGKAAAKFGALTQSAQSSQPAPSVAARAPEPGPEPLPERAAQQPEAAVAARVGATAVDSDEARRLTVFGARDGDVGGKPRHLGIILTAILLLFLAGVAAWAAVFLDDGIAGLFPRDDTRPATEIVETDPALIEEIAPDTDLAPEPEAQIELAALDVGPEITPPQDTLSQPALPAPRLSREEAQDLHAESGIWQRAPDAPAEIFPGDTADVYEASIDPDITVEDAVALPSGESLALDAPFDAPPNPLAAEVEYELDDRGLVVARLEGALNPEGVIVYLGKPPVIAPNRPDFASEGILTPEDAAEKARLSKLRPRARPDTNSLREGNERARLSGYSVEELAAIRPRQRPVTQKEVVEQEETTATAQAVAASLHPIPRPRDMSRIVARAEQLTQQEAETAEPVRTASAAAVAPRAVKPKTVKPSAPSPTTVARQATIENAINLRKINLIGVFGTQSQRRALVRLSNGRYQKVKVGDRIDGGRVSSISDSELRYKKGSRNIVLKMPRG